MSFKIENKGSRGSLNQYQKQVKYQKRPNIPTIPKNYEQNLPIRRKSIQTKGAAKSYKQIPMNSEQKNTNTLYKRSSKISNLQQQFQQLKKKIREVQNKNEKIIQKIHNNKEIQKKPQKNQVASSNLNKQFKQLQQPTNSIEYEISKTKEIHNKFKDSSQLELLIEEKEKEILSKNILIKKLQENNEYISMELQQQKIGKNQLLILNKQIEQKLKKEQYKLDCIKNNFKNYSECVKLIFQNQIQKFMETNILNKFNLIQKMNSQNFQKLQQIKFKLIKVKKQKITKNNRLLPPSPLKSNQKSRSIQFKEQNSKFRELENLVLKYQQLIKIKNQQYQNQSEKLKNKQRQINQFKSTIDKLKMEKKKLINQNQDNVESLENKISQLKQTNRKLSLEMMRLQKNKEREQKIENTNRTIKLYQNKLKESQQKYQSLHQELMNSNRQLQKKNKKIQTIQQQLNKLSNDYKIVKDKNDILEQNKLANKLQISNLKNRIQEIIIQSQKKQKQVLTIQKQPEGKAIQNTNLWRKQQNPYTAFNPEEINQLKIKLENSRKSQVNLQIQLNQSNMQNIKLKSTNQQLGNQINDMNSKIKSLNQKIIELQQNQKKNVQKYQSLFLTKKKSEENKTVQNLKELLQRQKQKYTTLQKREKQLKINFNRQTQSNKSKIKQLQTYAQQLNLLILQQQKIIELNEKEKQKQQFRQTKFKALQNQLLLIEEQFQIQKKLYLQQKQFSAQKSQELKKICEIMNKQKSDRLKIQYQNEKLQLRLKDILQELKNKDEFQIKHSDDFKQEIKKFKSQIQLKNKKIVQLEQENKYHKNKISQLQLELFMDKKSEENLSMNQQQNLNNKLKQIEKLLLEQDIQKINLERYLKNSEQKNTKLKNQVSALTQQLQKKKSQYNQLILSYDEKYLEQQNLIKQLEKNFKDKQFQKPKNQYEQKKSQLRSQSSLMFSMNSQFQQDKEIDFHLSQPDSQLVQTNIEELFGKLDYPYQKIKLRKKDQVYLLQRTRQYINNLKKTINQKNRKIKALQKKVESLREDKKQSDFPGMKDQEEDDFEELSDFNQNYSVRFQNKRGDNKRKIKQLQNESHLVMQQNHLLLQQVQKLQQQLLKAEQQQNGLVRMKQIYKQQINKLRKNSQQKQKIFKEEMTKLQKIIQESQSCHNLQTIRQLSIKIFTIIFNDEKKDQKKKQLEQYIKVLSSVLRIQSSLKDKFNISRK